MSWDTVQWILRVALFVLFLLVMLRGCGGMMGGMGGCGMGSPTGRRHRQGDDAAGRRETGSGGARGLQEGDRKDEGL